MNVSELKKLETNEYSSKLDEIAKNDTEVFLKVKLSGRRTFGEYEFEPKNGFAVKFGNHIDVLDLDKCDVYQLEQPKLNENQKALVIWMQENECYTGDPLESISDLFLEATPSEHFPNLPLSCVEAAYQSLTNQQKLQMVREYLQQYSEQGEK